MPYGSRPSLLPSLRSFRAFSGVVAFKRAWYRAIVENWPADGAVPAGEDVR